MVLGGARSGLLLCVSVCVCHGVVWRGLNAQKCVCMCVCLFFGAEWSDGSHSWPGVTLEVAVLVAVGWAVWCLSPTRPHQKLVD